jgi:hypothetical protein
MLEMGCVIMKKSFKQLKTIKLFITNNNNYYYLYYIV